MCTWQLGFSTLFASAAVLASQGGLGGPESLEVYLSLVVAHWFCQVISVIVHAIEFCCLGVVATYPHTTSRIAGIQIGIIMLDICGVGSGSFLTLQAGVAVRTTCTFTQCSCCFIY